MTEQVKEWIERLEFYQITNSHNDEILDEIIEFLRNIKDFIVDYFYLNLNGLVSKKNDLLYSKHEKHIKKFIYGEKCSLD